jgi:LPS export ABC transporter protein LptC
MRRYRKRGLWLFVLALVIASLSTWVNEEWSDQQYAIDQYDKEKLSYYFTRFSLLSNDKDGQTDHQITGKHLSHWKDQGMSKISNPEILTLTPVGKHRSRTTALEGYLFHNQEEVELIDNVKIREFDDSKKITSTLTTKKLSYNAQSRDVFTENPFKLESSDSTVTGVGMRGNLDSGQLKVLSNAQTHYKRQ